MLSAWLSSNVTVQHAEPDRPLEERWQWALEYAARNEFAAGYWTAFAIHRLFDANALAGTTNLQPSSYPGMLAGTLRGGMKEATQDLLFLFRFKPGGALAKDIVEIKVSNRPWLLDLGRRPLIWLGHAPEEESISRLVQLYRRLCSTELASDILVAAAAHSKPEMVARMAAALEEIALEEQHPSVQRGTIDLLFQLPFEAGLDSIVNLAAKHPSKKVRNEARQYLQESRNPRARAALHQLKREQ
ncbi:MAG: hypothetical protein QOF02_2082 [Blastocatellia bacterium]|jgi:hypothetical protein|nr:hypothetical protein [Blastocatellia bacterium]